MTRSLSVADPSSTNTGKLVNGTFALPQALQVRPPAPAAPAAAVGAGRRLVRSDGAADLAARSANDAVTITSSSTIGRTDALRTGAYSKTLTFTLSTTTP